MLPPLSEEQQNSIPFANVDDFRIGAQAILAKSILDYIDACAMDGITHHSNRADFDRLSLFPRVMRDVSFVDVSSTYLSGRSNLPIGISPMAFHQLAHPTAELGTVTAAKAVGVPITISAMSSRSLEDIARHAEGARLWLHVYLFKDRGVTRDLVTRAKAAGFEAITLGLGCPALGKRPINLRNRFKMPDGISPANLRDEGKERSQMSWVDAELDPSATWADVAELCRQTSLPVIGKGILNHLDVPSALDAGLSALMVSNHGGRQLDSSISSIRALPEIVAAVDGRVPVFLDGGVRRGTDILKAVSLGASAVFIGRPVLWALSVGGAQAVVEMLTMLADEYRLAMQLTGCTSLAEVRAMASDLLRRL